MPYSIHLIITWVLWAIIVRVRPTYLEYWKTFNYNLYGDLIYIPWTVQEAPELTSTNINFSQFKFFCPKDALKQMTVVKVSLVVFKKRKNLTTTIKLAWKVRRIRMLYLKSELINIQICTNVNNFETIHAKPFLVIVQKLKFEQIKTILKLYIYIANNLRYIV